MLKVSNRGCEEGVIKSSVKDGKSIYTITASRNENGKFSIFVTKNKKDYTLYSNIGASVKYVNKKIIEISKYEKIGFNFRTFGVGGLFGYFGYFNGNDVWYVTNIKKKIKISLTGKVYMISPENPECFLEETKKLIHK